VTRKTPRSEAIRQGRPERSTDAGLQLVVTAALIALIRGRAKAAEQKTVLKASDVHPRGYPTVQAVENMGKKL
jgi:TRAP-type C4-dicarboxylate transport system substrate-binding protein